MEITNHKLHRHFSRPEFAEQLVANLLGHSFSDAPNGLFLAAPRRTGKSTFLQRDLMPALEKAGVAVGYLDLWADTQRDPAAVIAESVGQQLRKHQALPKAARSMGVSSVGVSAFGASFTIDTTKIGTIDGATLVVALQAWNAAAGAPVALLIDEAQHALTSAGGEAAMKALKSARDQMNRPGEPSLVLVMTGSDRDKLLRLVTSNGAPFFGSRVTPMPELDNRFIDHIGNLILAQRPELAPIDLAVLSTAFARFGHRPQFFMCALDTVLSPLEQLTTRFETALLNAAEQARRDDEHRMVSDYLGLKPVEQAVLWRLLEQRESFRAYDAEALRFYAAKVGKKVSAAQAQAALERMRDQTPSLVWKSARGEYAVDDVDMNRWYVQRKEAGFWPPQQISG